MGCAPETSDFGNHEMSGRPDSTSYVSPFDEGFWNILTVPCRIARARSSSLVAVRCAFPLPSRFSSPLGRVLGLARLSEFRALVIDFVSLQGQERPNREKMARRPWR